MAIRVSRAPSHDDPTALTRERWTRRRRWILGSAAVAVLAALAILAYSLERPGRSQGYGRSTGVVPCTHDHLAISLVRTGSVTGEEGGLLRFKNLSGSSCNLSGWPTVRAIVANGTTVPSEHAVGGTMLFGWNWSKQQSPPKVTLQPNGSAYSILASADTARNGRPRKSCPTAKQLVVYAPGVGTKVKLSAWLPGDGAFLPLCGHAILLSPVLTQSQILR